MEYRIAVVGPKKLVSGFKALGADVFDAEDGAAAITQMEAIRATGTGDASGTPYAVVIIIERLVNEMSEDEYTRITKGALPALVVLPGLEGSTGASTQKLRELTTRAVGSDILSNEEK